MRKIDYYITAVIFVLIAFSCGPTVAGGQYVTIGWQVTGSGCQSGTITTGLDWDTIFANPDTPYTWEWLLQPEHPKIVIDLGEGDDNPYIDDLNITIKGEPRLTFGFSAAAGASDTHFIFTSDLLSVSPALTSAQGSASASVALGAPGDTFYGNYDGGTKTYRALYNGSTVFADLIHATVSDPCGYPGASDFVSSIPIPGQVSSMQAQWDVTISAYGSASGTSSYRITGTTIPEPASILLLGLGGLALIRKRRA